MKNRKPCKLNIILFIILILAGSIFFAMLENPEATTNIVSVGGVTKEYNTWISYDPNSYVTYNLMDMPYILCCQHGNPLIGLSKSLDFDSTIDLSGFGVIIMQAVDEGLYWQSSWNPFTADYSGTTFSTTKPEDMPEELLRHFSLYTEGPGGSYGFTENEYIFYTFGDYNAGSLKAATPMEAYILGHIDENTGIYPSDVQASWWATSAGSLGNRWRWSTFCCRSGIPRLCCKHNRII